LKPNVDGTITALRLFGKDFTEFLHKDLIDDFTIFRVTLFKIFDDPRYRSVMTSLSKLFADSFSDIRNKVFKYLKMISDDPNVILTTLTPIIENFKQGLVALGFAIEAIGLFIMGFFRSDMGMASFAANMEALRDGAYNAGVGTSELIGEISTLALEMQPLLRAVSYLGNFVTLAVSTIASALTLFGYVAEQVAARITWLATLGMSEWANRTLDDSYGHERAAEVMGHMERMQRAAYGILGWRLGGTEGEEGANNAAVTPPPQNAANQAAANPHGARIPNAAVMTAGQPGGFLGGQARIGPIPGSQPIDFSNQLNNPNIQLNDNAVVEAFRVARPMRFEPRRMDQNISVNVGTMNVTANNAQDLIDQFVNLGAGNVNRPGPQRIQGPFSPDAAAQRGLIY
jgi:hypothetical protein